MEEDRQMEISILIDLIKSICYRYNINLVPYANNDTICIAVQDIISNEIYLMIEPENREVN